jgi:hypothetical protein
VTDPALRPDEGDRPDVRSTSSASPRSTRWPG